MGGVNRLLKIKLDLTLWNSNIFATLTKINFFAEYKGLCS